MGDPVPERRQLGTAQPQRAALGCDDRRDQPQGERRQHRIAGELMHGVGVFVAAEVGDDEGAGEDRVPAEQDAELDRLRLAAHRLQVASQSSSWCALSIRP